jgi:hypothetical protein
VHQPPTPTRAVVLVQQPGEQVACRLARILHRSILWHYQPAAGKLEQARQASVERLA